MTNIIKGKEENMILLKYYDGNARSFLEYFEKVKRKLREEPIHQLRLHIKRMRAILELIEITSKGKFKKKHHFSLFSKFFNSAGALREMQVNHLIIRKFHNNGVGPFEEYLKQRQTAAGRKLQKAVIKFDTGKFKKENYKIRSAVKEMDEEKIISQSEKFISREIRKIKKLRFKLSDPRKLHKIRILLKSVSAILKLLKAYKPDNKWARLKNDIKPLELLIGEWHDRQVLVSTINRFIVKNEDGNKKLGNVKKLVKRIEVENRKKVREVERRLEAVF